MVKWALGTRLPDSTKNKIASAIDKGKVIRTHILRPTYHITSSEDIYWMLELTAPQIKSALKHRHKELGITNKILSKSFNVITRALEANENLTQDELIKELNRAKISTKEDIASHIFILAELEELICSGISKEYKPTYTLLEKRVPIKKRMEREEAIKTLAKKYFSSHAPATLKDFSWWSGLPAKEARLGIEMNKSFLTSHVIDNETFFLPKSFFLRNKRTKSICILPAFDEFVVGYKTRDIIFNDKDFSKSVFNNGIFRPVIIVNGKIVGTWKRGFKKDKLLVETQLFNRRNYDIKMIEKEFVKFGKFWETEIEISHGKN
jgi:hypothetical protein